MNKQHIIEEIIRTAKENNGIPLGKMKFETETGIKENDWRGKYWAKWSDAIKKRDRGSCFLHFKKRKRRSAEVKNKA